MIGDGGGDGCGGDDDVGGGACACGIENGIRFTYFAGQMR